MELAEDVAEEVLHLIPGVDTVGTIQHDHNVHVCGAPYHMWELTNIWLVKVGLCSMCLALVCVCKCVATLCSWSDGFSWLEVIADGGADAGAEHGRTALLRPKRGTRLPDRSTYGHIKTHKTASVLQVK